MTVYFRLNSLVGRSVWAYVWINETVCLQVCWESKPKMEQSEANTLVTPNTLVYGKDMYYLGENIDSVNGDLRKRVKYIRRYKGNAWEWWKIEYSKFWCEKHNLQSKKQKFPPLSTGDVLIIEGHERNRNHWTNSCIRKRWSYKSFKIADRIFNFGMSNAIVIPIRTTLR